MVVVAPMKSTERSQGVCAPRLGFERMPARTRTTMATRSAGISARKRYTMRAVPVGLVGCGPCSMTSRTKGGSGWTWMRCSSSVRCAGCTLSLRGHVLEHPCEGAVRHGQQQEDQQEEERLRRARGAPHHEHDAEHHEHEERARDDHR